MALTGKDILAWARGSQAEAAKPSALNATPPEGGLESMEEDMEEETGERNPIWSGEQPVDETTPPEVVDDLFMWLEENEPEIFDALMDVANAITTGDVRMLEHGKQELQAATQLLNPEYPPMPPEKRTEAADRIGQHMQQKGHPAKGTPAWKKAVAIGLSEARQNTPTEGEEMGEGKPLGGGMKPPTTPKPPAGIL